MPNPPPTTTTTTTTTTTAQVHNPRITIQYCTQCKWMLRAAYLAQELLSTFSTDLGEVALVPGRGGVFTVTVFCSGGSAASGVDDAGAEDGGGGEAGNVVWDRRRDGGFPEVKALKALVRDVIDPGRDLGHTDRALRVGQAGAAGTEAGVMGEERKEEEQKKQCEDCR